MTIPEALVFPQRLMITIGRYRQLILQLVRREIIGRYRGSIMGLAWSFLNPLLMLAIYTVFFSIAYRARMGTQQTDFAMMLFVGLIVHGLFAECISRAPALIIQNTNYVKKVLFPLEILPIVTVISALFHACVSIIVLLAMQLLWHQSLAWTCIFFPLVLMPFIFLLMGSMWLLSALGVYIRDIGQMMGMLISILLFMSPVFYPVSSLPEKLQSWILLNPLTFIIEQSREVVLYNQLPDWYGLGIYTAISIAIAGIGYACFQKLRQGFADVL